MKKIILQILVICGFWNVIVTAIDPLLNFAKNSGNQALIEYNNSDVFVRGIHHTPTSIIVVLSTPQSEGVIQKYNYDGSLQNTITMSSGCGVLRIEDRMQILWEDDYFYIPGYNDAPANGFIQKYNYNLELDPNFGDSGTLLLGGGNDDFASFTSVTSVNNKYFAAGYVQNDNNNNNSIQSKYRIIDFNNVNGYVNYVYEEQNFTIGGTRKIDFIAISYLQGMYFVLATGETNNLMYAALNINMHLLFFPVGINDGITVDTLIKIDDVHWYGVDNNGNLLYLITLGWLAMPPVVAEVVYTFTNNDPMWISSAVLIGDLLFLAGEYNVLNNPLTMTPFIKVYNVSNKAAPIVDTTVFPGFFNTEWSNGTAYHRTGYKSAIDFFVKGPYSFLFGYRNLVIHIANFIGTSASLAARVKDSFTPWIS